MERTGTVIAAVMASEEAKERQNVELYLDALHRVVNRTGRIISGQISNVYVDIYVKETASNGD